MANNKFVVKNGLLTQVIDFVSPNRQITTTVDLANTGILNISGVVSASGYTGTGTGLTNLDASNLTTGTVSTARLGSGTANTTTWLRGDGTWQVGPLGYTGSQGTAGYTGSQGAVGYTGSVGYTGNQGITGYTGSQGITGYTGSKGDIGYTGSTGTQEIARTGTNIYSSQAGTGGTGTNNFFAGQCAGYCNTTGSSNNFFGLNAGYCNTTGGNNNFFGCSAGYSNSGGLGNNFFGFNAGYCNTTGGSNNFFGVSSGRFSTTGSNNNFFGFNAGYCNTTGGNNNFFGYWAGCSNTTGNNNTFIGSMAGWRNTTGSSNMFIGQGAGSSNTAGNSNNFIGDFVGYSNTTGNNNTFIGRYSGRSNTTGYDNFFAGQCAGYCNTTGYNNTFIGCFAGCSVITGTNNIIIGSTPGTSALSDTVILAAGTTERLKVDPVGLTVNSSLYGVSVLKASTTNGSATVLTTDGTAPGAVNQIILPNDSTYAFKMLIVARRTDVDGESAGYEFSGVIDRNTNAASTALVGSATKTVLAEDSNAWDAAVSADTTNGGIKIEVTGETSKTISWVATVWTSRVTG